MKKTLLFVLPLLLIISCEKYYEKSNTEWFEYSKISIQEELSELMKKNDVSASSEYCTNWDELSSASKTGWNSDGTQGTSFSTQYWMKLWYYPNGKGKIYKGARNHPAHSISWTKNFSGSWSLQLSPSVNTMDKEWSPSSHNSDEIIFNWEGSLYFEPITTITSKLSDKDEELFFTFVDSIKDSFMSEHNYIFNNRGWFERSEDHWKNGKKHGKWYTYHSVRTNEDKDWGDKAVVETEVHYREGKLDGLYTKWYENGRKHSEETYKDGERDGLWTYWYENGQKLWEWTWKDGMNGPYKEWYLNGHLSDEGNYKNGKKDGLWTEFYEKNGLKKSDVTYYNGELVGSIVKYPENENTIVPFIPEFIFVEGGSFEMGISQNWIDAQTRGLGEWRRDGIANQYKSEIAHTVTLSDFYIGKTEVTFKEYDIFCEATGRTKPENVQYWGRKNRPVYNVSWDNAVAYCEWLSNYTGKDIRLPTEAEWEYAARGGNKSKGYFMSGFGDWTDNESHMEFIRSNNTALFAWFDDREEETREHGTGPVGQLRPNELGIYDMTGNVAEWCSDWYDKNYYIEMSNEVAINPAGPPSSDSKVVRGSNFFEGANLHIDKLVCVRDFEDKSYTMMEYFGDIVGFRCVMEK